MGNTLFNPARDGHALDRLRHADPKIARKLRGVGSRAKQYATLQEEGIMGTTVTTAHTASGSIRAKYDARKERGFVGITVQTTPEARDRWSRIRGEASNAAAFDLLLDTYEQRQTSPNATITTEVANILADLQAKLGLPTQLAAVKRLMESQEAAVRRAETIRNLKEQRDEFKRQVAASRETETTSVAVSATHPEVQDIVLDLLDTLAGATATLDPSGEIVVRDLPAGAERKLFGLWQRGVAALGIRKREG